MRSKRDPRRSLGGMMEGAQLLDNDEETGKSGSKKERSTSAKG